jgi:hypothetical protein
MEKSMDETKKTKAQLIEELEQANARISKLKAEIAKLAESVNEDAVARAPRKEIQSEIEFIADTDIIHATGMNLSDSGICFESSDELPFEMKFESGGQIYEKRAHLVWVRRLPEGKYRFGLNFVPPKPGPKF